MPEDLPPVTFGPQGEAICERHADGTVTVVHADPIIRVSAGLLDQLKRAESWAWDGETLQLDTAGEYRYRRVAEDEEAPGVWIFVRNEGQAAREAARRAE